MKIYENLWKSMKTYENLRKSMKISGNPWKSMKIYEDLWKSTNSIEVNRDTYKQMKTKSIEIHLLEPLTPTVGCLMRIRSDSSSYQFYVTHGGRTYSCHYLASVLTARWSITLQTMATPLLKALRAVRQDLGALRRSMMKRDLAARSLSQFT